MIQSGHSFGEIKAYTLAQVEAFSEAAARGRRRQLADDAVTARATQYDETGFQKYLKTLTD